MNLNCNNLLSKYGSVTLITLK